MAGSITISSITLDSDNNFSIKSNTGATLFFANTTGIDVANSFASSSITSDKILTVANTQISGNIVSSQITSVANTQITGNIISSQIASVSGSVITANTIANSAIQTGAVENYMNAAGLGFGMRNRIINGAMVISQRSNTTATTVNTNDVYTLDRFKGWASGGGVFTVTQSSTAPTGFANSALITVTTADASIAAGDNYRFAQAIEGYNIADLGFGTASASTVTLSFWVRSNITGTFGGSLYSVGGTRAYVFNYTINAANTFEYKTVTIAGDTSGTWGTVNSTGITVYFDLGSGSNYENATGSWVAAEKFRTSGNATLISTLSNTWYITGVQLEKGSTATSFDYRPYGTELALCQRYFELYDGGLLYLTKLRESDRNRRGNFYFKVTKRAAATITLITSSADGGGAISATGGIDGGNFENLSTTDGQTPNVTKFSAAIEL